LVASRPAGADLKLIPAITVSERYDSNVLFVEGHSEDFVTSVIPELRAEYQGRPLTGEVYGRVSIDTFAKRSSLNNASASGGLSVNLTQLIGRLDKRATLQFTDTLYYTPELPAFFSPVPGTTQPEPDQPAVVGQTPFAIGILPQRVESFSNSSSLAGGYALTRLLNLNAGYSYSFINFGGTKGLPAQASLFRTTTQNVNAGPAIQLSPFDSVSAQYVYQKSDSKTGGSGSSFFTNGATVGYGHIFSPQLTANVTAGATVVSTTDQVSELASASASWTEKSTAATLLYSRSISPSFTVSAQALVSDVVSLSVSQALTQRLSGNAQVNYARSTGASAGSDLFFQSYGGNVALYYAIFKTVSGSLSYSHFRFEQDSQTTSSAFNRDQVTLSIRAEWR
jgi:putative beta-barrel porin BBP2